MKKFLMALLMAAASPVHALSPDEVKQYLSGEGMGYAPLEALFRSGSVDPSR